MHNAVYTTMLCQFVYRTLISYENVSSILACSERGVIWKNCIKKWKFNTTVWVFSKHLWYMKQVAIETNMYHTRWSHFQCLTRTDLYCPFRAVINNVGEYCASVCKAELIYILWFRALLLYRVLFLPRDVIYASRLCYDVSVRLSVRLWRKCIGAL